MSNTKENQEACVDNVKEVFPQLKGVNIWGEHNMFFLATSETGDDVKICGDYLFGVHGIREEVAEHINKELEKYGFYWECQQAGCYVAVYDDLATINTNVWCLNTDDSNRVDCLNAKKEVFYEAISGCPF